MRTNRLSPAASLVGIAAGLALALCQYLIFVYAPVEQSMGIVQKIFYFHMPLAWWSLFSFFTVFVAGIAFLRTRDWRWDALSGAAAEVGVLFSGLALITGSIWGRHSWGVWWTWDPRLTTTLVMWFVYAGYLVLRSLDLPRERLGIIAAVVGIVAFLDVPLVFLSARLWRSIHPAVFAAKGGGLEPEMQTTVMACIVAFGFLWASLTGLRAAQRRMAARMDALAAETTI